MFQATTGLDYLHRNHFVHRNVKPSSFLIKEILEGKYVVKITDFRLSRQVDPGGIQLLSGSVASAGWIAPESCKTNQRLHSSLDVFILGCFFHYVLNGQHPFGTRDTERFGNILNPDFPVYRTETWSPARIEDRQAVDLIKMMIQNDETKRPNLFQVLNHPFFQTTENKEFYPIYHYEKPGLCVIINQEIFLDVSYLYLKYKNGSYNYFCFKGKETRRIDDGLQFNSRNFRTSPL